MPPFIAANASSSEIGVAVQVILLSHATNKVRVVGIGENAVNGIE